ncbi:PD40 domain-containing protein [Halobacillus sp. BBL2006]|uniref:PD40 domain-containing protein n=1 Tax=Halobacillus sp. BBL2006 TaxID=1543706 RepID=UPI0018CCBED2|nr:PD40 domain-containing protein [Halobacillus sp. BBL2006]
MKKKNTIFLSIVAVAFALLYWTGTFAKGPIQHTGLGRSPVLSPDGKELLFPYDKNGESALYTAPASGGKAELLLEPKTMDSYVHPAYSPDGTKLLYIKEYKVEGKPYNQLMMYDMLKKKSQPLQDIDHYISEAVFGPDGKQVYYTEAKSYQNNTNGDGMFAKDFDIYQMNLDTYETKQLTKRKLFSLSGLQMTSEGKYLLFSLYNGENLVQRMNLETKKVETITPEPEYKSAAQDGPNIGSPALSPDGTRIAFSDVASKNDRGTYQYEVFTMKVSGENVQQVTKFKEHVTEPVFFPNGKELLVTVDQNFAGRRPDYEYWRISTDGKDRKEIIIELPEE